MQEKENFYTINTDQNQIVMQFPIKSGGTIPITYSQDLADKHRFTFLQIYHTDKDQAFAIGVYQGKVCYWLAKEEDILYHQPSLDSSNDSLVAVTGNDTALPTKLIATLENIFKMGIKEILALKMKNAPVVLKDICSLKINPELCNVWPIQEELSQMFRQNPDIFMNEVEQLLSIIDNDARHLKTQREVLNITSPNLLEQQITHRNDLCEQIVKLDRALEKIKKETSETETTRKIISDQIILLKQQLKIVDQVISNFDLPTLDLDQIGEAVLFIFGFLKNLNMQLHQTFIYPERGEPHGTNYKKLALKIGEFIYNNAPIYLSKEVNKAEQISDELYDNTHKIALLCFIIAGDLGDAPILKEACYLALLKEKGLPKIINLEKLTQKEESSEKANTFLQKLLADKFFSDSLERIRGNSIHSWMEEIRLNYLLEMTANHLDIDNNSKSPSDAASILLSEFVNINIARTKFLLPLLESYFANNLEICLKLANATIDTTEQIIYLETAIKLMKKMEFKVHLDDQLLFTILALSTSDDKDNEIYETGKRFALFQVLNNNFSFLDKAILSVQSVSRAKFLLYLSSGIQDKAFLLKIFSYVDKYVSGEEKKKFTDAELFQYYKLTILSEASDICLLIELAKRGSEEALSELKTLAIEKKNFTIRETLGDIYYAKATNPEDFELAANCYSMEPRTHGSILNLCKLVLEEKISTKINLVGLISEMVEITVEPAIFDVAIKLIEKFEGNPTYNSDALTALIKLNIARVIQSDFSHWQAYNLELFLYHNVHKYQEKISDLLPVLQFPKIIIYLLPEILFKIFDLLYSCDEGKKLLTPLYKDLANSFVAERNCKYTIKILSCPELRSHVDIESLLESMDNLEYFLELLSLLKELLCSEVSQQTVSWLYNKRDIVLYIAHSKKWFPEFATIQNFNKVMETLFKRKTDPQEKLFVSSIDSNNNNNTGFLSTFFKKAGSIPHKDRHEQNKLVEDKLELFELLHEGKSEVSFETKFYFEDIIKRLNTVNSRPELEAIIEELKQNDCFFAYYYGNSENKSPN